MKPRVLFLAAIAGAVLLLVCCSPEGKRGVDPAGGSQKGSGNARGGGVDSDNVPEEIVRLERELRAALRKFDDQKQIRWLAENYGNTAVNIAKRHGRTGVEVILALGQHGVAVMREHPDTFEKVADQLGG